MHLVRWQVGGDCEGTLRKERARGQNSAPARPGHGRHRPGQAGLCFCMLKDELLADRMKSFAELPARYSRSKGCQNVNFRKVDILFRGGKIQLLSGQAMDGIDQVKLLRASITYFTHCFLARYHAL